METPAETKRYTYVKGIVKFVRRKTTQQGRPMLLFAVVGENTTEVCTYFPSHSGFFTGTMWTLALSSSFKDLLGCFLGEKCPKNEFQRVFKAPIMILFMSLA